MTGFSTSFSLPLLTMESRARTSGVSAATAQEVRATGKTCSFGCYHFSFDFTLRFALEIESFPGRLYIVMSPDQHLLLFTKVN